MLATIAGTAAAGKALKAAELKKAVSMGYVGLLYLQRQIIELKRVDSIYARVANIFAQRLAQGATAAPMAQLAQLQSENITMEIAVLTSELTVAQIQFQVLTNTRLPYSADPSAEIVPISNFTSDFNHVLLLQTQAAQNTATATTKYEQKRLLPEFSIQVNSNTIRGVGGDEKKYGYGTRFTSAHLGLQIPLFLAATRARIAAGKVNQELAFNQTQIAKQGLAAQRRIAQLRYETCLRKQTYYKQTAQKLATEIEQGVTRNLESGLVDYTDWLPLIAPTIATRNEANMAQYQLHLATIELNYLNKE